jgi:hypothetical protein
MYTGTPKQNRKCNAAADAKTIAGSPVPSRVMGGPRQVGVGPGEPPYGRSSIRACACYCPHHTRRGWGCRRGPWVPISARMRMRSCGCGCRCSEGKRRSSWELWVGMRPCGMRGRQATEESLARPASSVRQPAVPMTPGV